MSNIEEFLTQLKENSPALKKHAESEQYNLSLEILEYMLSNNLTEITLAEKLNISIDYMMRILIGDNNLEVKEFTNILNKLNIYN